MPFDSKSASAGGKKGGKAKVPKGFAVNRKLASEAGRKGGKISKRTKKRNDEDGTIRTNKADA